MSIVSGTTSTFAALNNEFLVNPAGTDSEANVKVSLSTSKPLITMLPSKATGLPSTNETL